MIIFNIIYSFTIILYGPLHESFIFQMIILPVLNIILKLFCLFLFDDFD